MDMVRNATDLDDYTTNIANNATNIEPYTLKITLLQPGAARFDMKYEVYIYFY